MLSNSIRACQKQLVVKTVLPLEPFLAQDNSFPPERPASLSGLFSTASEWMAFCVTVKDIVRHSNHQQDNHVPSEDEPGTGSPRNSLLRWWRSRSSDSERASATSGSTPSNYALRTQLEALGRNLIRTKKRQGLRSFRYAPERQCLIFGHCRPASSVSRQRYSSTASLHPVAVAVSVPELLSEQQTVLTIQATNDLIWSPPLRETVVSHVEDGNKDDSPVWAYLVAPVEKDIVEEADVYLCNSSRSLQSNSSD